MSINVYIWIDDFGKAYNLSYKQSVYDAMSLCAFFTFGALASLFEISMIFRSEHLSNYFYEYEQLRDNEFDTEFEFLPGHHSVESRTYMFAIIIFSPVITMIYLSLSGHI